MEFKDFAVAFIQDLCIFIFRALKLEEKMSKKNLMT